MQLGVFEVPGKNMYPTWLQVTATIFKCLYFVA